MTTDSDLQRELIDKARRRDHGAFERLLEETADPVEYYVRLRLGSRLRAVVEADDVLQEVAIRAYRSLDRFRWRGERSFLRWLKGIAEHVIIDMVRRDRRRPVVPLADDENPAGDDSSQGAILRREERFERLQEAFDSLSADHRKVILLARLEKLSLDVVAERMDRSPDAVKQLLYRALGQLRDRFGETESLGLPDRRLENGGATDDE